MKERPIIFSAEMVRAILDGKKTQTRRVIKDQPVLWSTRDGEEAGFTWRKTGGGNGPTWERQKFIEFCPYGVPGDRLWVRETWAHYQTVNYVRRADGRAFSEVSDGLAGYKADGFDSIDDFADHVRLMSDTSLEAVEINGDRWRPSIHMPRWASRITLEVRDVRVERVQDINWQDARYEGLHCEIDASGHAWYSPDKDKSIELAWGHRMVKDPRIAFKHLWNSLNAKRGFGWETNCWVWVVEFKVEEGGPRGA